MQLIVTKWALEGTAPEESVYDMDISAHTLMHQGGAVETLSCQFSKGFARFILFCEVTNENANAHYVSFTQYVV